MRGIAAAIAWASPQGGFFKLTMSLMWDNVKSQDASIVLINTFIFITLLLRPLYLCGDFVVKTKSGAAEGRAATKLSQRGHMTFIVQNVPLQEMRFLLVTLTPESIFHVKLAPNTAHHGWCIFPHQDARSRAQEPRRKRPCRDWDRHDCEWERQDWGGSEDALPTQLCP